MIKTLSFMRDRKGSEWGIPRPWNPIKAVWFQAKPLYRMPVGQPSRCLAALGYLSGDLLMARNKISVVPKALAYAKQRELLPLYVMECQLFHRRFSNFSSFVSKAEHGSIDCLTFASHTSKEKKR